MSYDPMMLEKLYAVGCEACGLDPAQRPKGKLYGLRLFAKQGISVVWDSYDPTGMAIYARTVIFPVALRNFGEHFDPSLEVHVPPLTGNVDVLSANFSVGGLRRAITNVVEETEFIEPFQVKGPEAPLPEVETWIQTISQRRGNSTLIGQPLPTQPQG